MRSYLVRIADFDIQGTPKDPNTVPARKGTQYTRTSTSTRRAVEELFKDFKFARGKYAVWCKERLNSEEWEVFNVTV